jgi:hypothetical protein
MPSPDDDNPPTLYTPSATSRSTSTIMDQSSDSQSSVPWPGRTFIIRSRFNGQVITFLNGDIVLEKPGSLGTFRWRCVENNGWLGFRDPASANYMGHSKGEHLPACCTVNHHRDREYFSPRRLPDGGYVILALLDKTLVPIGVHPLQAESGELQKVMIRDWKSEGIAWDFIEVQG